AHRYPNMRSVLTTLRQCSPSAMVAGVAQSTTVQAPPGAGPTPSGGLREAPPPVAVSIVEELERDRIGHRLLPGIARMQVVPAVIGRQHARGMSRVADGGVEIDDPVIGVGRADPMVHGLPLDLLLRRIEAGNGRAFEGRESGAEDPDESQF